MSQKDRAFNKARFKLINSIPVNYRQQQIYIVDFKSEMDTHFFNMGGEEYSLPKLTPSFIDHRKINSDSVSFLFFFLFCLSIYACWAYGLLLMTIFFIVDKWHGRDNLAKTVIKLHRFLGGKVRD